MRKFYNVIIILLVSLSVSACGLLKVNRDDCEAKCLNYKNRINQTLGIKSGFSHLSDKDKENAVCPHADNPENGNIECHCNGKICNFYWYSDINSTAHTCNFKFNSYGVFDYVYFEEHIDNPFEYLLKIHR